MSAWWVAGLCLVGLAAGAALVWGMCALAKACDEAVEAMNEE